MHFADGPNPFIPRHWTPDLFVGRTEFCRCFYERITSFASDLPHEGRHFEVTGLPGIGRTSLLRFLADPEGAASRFVEDLPPAFQPGGRYRFLPVLIEFEHRVPDEHPFVFLWRRFLDVLRAAKVKGLDEISTMDARIADDPARTIDAISQAFGILLQSNELCFLLLDDFDQALLDDGVSEDQVKKLGGWKYTNTMVVAGRTLLSEHEKLRGTFRRAVGASLEEPRPSTFLRSLESQALMPFSESEAFRCLSIRSEGWPGGRGDEDAERLYKLTGGLPDLLIRGAGVLWDLKTRAASGTDQPSVPESWLKTSLKSQLKGLLSDIAATAIDDEMRVALQAHRSGAFSEVDQIPLFRGVDSGVLSVDLHQEKKQFKLFSPLLEDFVFDSPRTTQRRVTQDGLEEAPATLGHLSRTEKKLYEYLNRHAGETCEFDQLWQNVWNAEDADDRARRTIQVTVSRLRDKLPHSKVVIEPVRSRGYRLLAVGG